MHRSPLAFVFELIRQGKKDLSLIKTAGALDIDSLALAKSIRSVYAGYIGFEMLALPQNYRKGVQKGEITVHEHACASVIAGTPGEHLWRSFSADPWFPRKQTS